MSESKPSQPLTHNSSCLFRYVIIGGIIGALTFAIGGCINGAIVYYLTEQRSYDVWAAALASALPSGFVGAVVGALSGTIVKTVIVWKEKGDIQDYQ